VKFGRLLWVGFILAPLATFGGYRIWHQPKDPNATIDSAPKMASVPDKPLAPWKPCKVPDKDFGATSNAWGHGSPYFGFINKCANGVALDIDLWSVSEADYRITSNSCPDKFLGGHVPKIDDRRGRVKVELKRLGEFFSTEIEKFGNICRVDPSTSIKLLDGFRVFYADELGRSWIHNRYIEKLAKRNRLGWKDEKLRAEAIAEYDLSH
jgi:hypothetical protein